MKYIYTILLLYITACGPTIGYRPVKNEIMDVYYNNSGLCTFVTEPQHNKRVLVSDTCGTHRIGDSITTYEMYYIEKE